MSTISDLVSQYIGIKQAELDLQPSMRDITELIFIPEQNKIIRKRGENDLDILVHTKDVYTLELTLIARINRHLDEQKKKEIKQEESIPDWPQFDKAGV